MTEQPTTQEQAAVGLEQEVQDKHTVFRKGGEYAGLVSQSPNHPDVMNPGSWSAAIHTADGGLWNFGPFETRENATKAGAEGLGRNWTFDQWVQEAEKSK